MTIDEQINKILPFIDSNGRHFSYLYKAYIEQTDDENKIDRLMDKMILLGLIKKVGNFEPSMNMDIVSLDHEGDVVNESGGWIKYMENKKIKSRPINISIEQLQNIQDSVINAPVTQSSDSSSNKSINEPKQNNKKPINIKTIIKFVFWVLGAILTVYGIYEMLVKWKII